MTDLRDPARKTHLFACAYCRYTKEIGPGELVHCPRCSSNAGTYRILDYEIVTLVPAANPGPA